MILALMALVHLLNMLFDSPHELESRPNLFEVCWSKDALWIEQAGPDSYVCDGTGVEILRFDLD